MVVRKVLVSELKLAAEESGVKLINLRGTNKESERVMNGGDRLTRGNFQFLLRRNDEQWARSDSPNLVCAHGHQFFADKIKQIAPDCVIVSGKEPALERSTRLCACGGV